MVQVGSSMNHTHLPGRGHTVHQWLAPLVIFASAAALLALGLLLR
jgi:hypothetical protein